MELVNRSTNTARETKIMARNATILENGNFVCSIFAFTTKPNSIIKPHRRFNCYRFACIDVIVNTYR